MGQVSTYTEEIAERICLAVADGQNLRALCRDNADFPAWRTVYAWINENQDFAARYARARVLGFDAIAFETQEIADTPVQAYIEEQESFPTGEKDEHGMPVFALRTVKRKVEDALGHRKLQIDTRRWLLSKWDPKRYGDRLELAGDKSAPLTVQLVQFDKGESK